MEDGLGPIASVEAGSAVTVIPRGGARGGRGVLTSAHLFSLVVDGAGPEWHPGDDVIISSGEPGATVAALARFREYRGESAVFTRQSPWRPFNRRAFQRYSVRLEVVIGTAPHEVAATIVDVSLGGAGVAAPAAPAAQGVNFTLGVLGREAALPARVVGWRADDSGFVWHLEFEELSSEAAVLVEDLVETLARSLAEEAA